MPDTTTANYGWTKPEVGGSDDTWGNKLNDDLDAIDTELKALSDTIDALIALVPDEAGLLAALLTVDGAGSGLDADLLDGKQAADFVLGTAYTAADVLTKLKTVDGAGSGLDADLLDGKHASEFALLTDVAGELAIDPSLTAFGGLAFAADKLAYSTGVDAFALTAFTAFGRSVVGLADAGALGDLIGSVNVDGESLASPGYVELSNGLIIQWGTGTLAGNALGTINYPVAFTTFAIPVVSGADANTGHEGGVAAYGTTLAHANIINSSIGLGTYFWIAVGK